MGKSEGSSPDTQARGRLVAMTLAGAWRIAPPPLPPVMSNVETVVPLLAESGAGGLAWHRLRQTSLRSLRAVRELQQHYRLQTLQAAQRTSAVRELLLRLRTVGIEPILIKGWSSARLYPEPGLRPSADIDLCVPANELQTAVSALGSRALPCAVDLHPDVPELADRSWREVFDRSLLVPLDDVSVRVLGPEDELRLLCLHLARHGIARPLWLCDIAARLESLPISFDWDSCRAGRNDHTEWMSCVLVLAHRLLTADFSAVPPLGIELPLWVEKAVVWCWGVGSGRPLRHYLWNPGDIVRRVRYHGISPRQGSTPIKAALHLGLGPHWNLPLTLVQLAAFVRRKIPHVVQRLRGRRRIVSLLFTIHSH